MTRIKRVLREKNLRPRIFAQLGVSEATIYKFVNRQAVLPSRWREPFAELLGVEVNEICEPGGLACLDDESKVA